MADYRVVFAGGFGFCLSDSDTMQPATGRKSIWYRLSFSQTTGIFVSYVNAYDSVVEEAIRRKFGRDVFHECADEAATKWKAQRAAAAWNVEVRQ